MSSFSNQTKNTTVFTDKSKNTSDFSSDVDFLLKQDSFYILLQNGDFIILKAGRGESKHSSDYNMQIKN